MLTVAFFYTLVPIILTVLAVLFTKKATALYILIPIYLIALLIAYFALPSRNVLSMIWGNTFWTFIWGIAFIPINANIEASDADKPNRGIAILGIALMIILFVVGVVGGLHSWMSVKPTWNSIDKVYSKSTEAPTFKRGETPIALAPKTVLNRVRKVSSDIPNSQYFSISDDIQAQYYKGKPVYVIPVEYNGFFQMQKAQEIPGYFMIDATRQNASPKFINKPYTYATSAYFGRDAERQIYRHLPDWLSLDTAQLEIDDEGNPFWVETVYKPEPLSHRVNYQDLHVAVMDAKTGSVKLYDIHNLPKFIDEGITTGIANKINSDFGKYKYGFWNWSNTGVMKPTGNGVENGVTSVFNKNGTISYFTDFTTDRTGSDSALGYSMIDARTGKLTFYKANNIMDSDGAKQNANQDYKAQRWHANMPILYNVNGRPTWVMTILDQTHAIRGYYYLDAANQSTYASGSTPTSALDAFRQALVNSGSSAGNTKDSKIKEVTGTVDRVAIVSNQNKVMFTLKGKKTIYTVNTNDFVVANLMKPRDRVSFKANVVNGNSVGNVSSFKDTELR